MNYPEEYFASTDIKSEALRPAIPSILLLFMHTNILYKKLIKPAYFHNNYTIL